MNDHWKEFKEMCANHYWGSLDKDKQLILDHIDGIIRNINLQEVLKDMSKEEDILKKSKDVFMRFACGSDNIGEIRNLSMGMVLDIGKIDKPKDQPNGWA